MDTYDMIHMITYMIWYIWLHICIHARRRSDLNNYDCKNDMTEGRISSVDGYIYVIISFVCDSDALMRSQRWEMGVKNLWDMRVANLQHTATHCNTRQHNTTHYNTLQQRDESRKSMRHESRESATHCNTLQHATTHYNKLQLTATHCNTLQHPTTNCNTLQHTTTHCNTLQHTWLRGRRG